MPINSQCIQTSDTNQVFAVFARNKVIVKPIVMSRATIKPTIQQPCNNKKEETASDSEIEEAEEEEKKEKGKDNKKKEKKEETFKDAKIDAKPDKPKTDCPTPSSERMISEKIFVKTLAQFQKGILQSVEKIIDQKLALERFSEGEPARKKQRTSIFSSRHLRKLFGNSHRKRNSRH